MADNIDDMFDAGFFEDAFAAMEQNGFNTSTDVYEGTLGYGITGFGDSQAMVQVQPATDGDAACPSSLPPLPNDSAGLADLSMISSDAELELLLQPLADAINDTYQAALTNKVTAADQHAGLAADTPVPGSEDGARQAPASPSDNPATTTHTCPEHQPGYSTGPPTALSPLQTTLSGQASPSHQRTGPVAGTALQSPHATTKEDAPPQAGNPALQPGAAEVNLAALFGGVHPLETLTTETQQELMAQLDDVLYNYDFSLPDAFPPNPELNTAMPQPYHGNIGQPAASSGGATPVATSGSSRFTPIDLTTASSDQLFSAPPVPSAPPVSSASPASSATPIPSASPMTQAPLVSTKLPQPSRSRTGSRTPASPPQTPAASRKRKAETDMAAAPKRLNTQDSPHAQPTASQSRPNKGPRPRNRPHQPQQRVKPPKPKMSQAAPSVPRAPQPYPDQPTQAAAPARAQPQVQGLPAQPPASHVAAYSATMDGSESSGIDMVFLAGVEEGARMFCNMVLYGLEQRTILGLPAERALEPETWQHPSISGRLRSVRRSAVEAVMAETREWRRLINARTSNSKAKASAPRSFKGGPREAVGQQALTKPNAPKRAETKAPAGSASRQQSRHIL